MVTSIRSSGRVVVSAAAVMNAVFLTFALSGPLAPKWIGVILAIAVALDSVLVRMALLPVLFCRGGQHGSGLSRLGLARYYRPSNFLDK